MKIIKGFLFSIFTIFLLISHAYSEEKVDSQKPPILIKIGVMQDLDSQILQYIQNTLITEQNIDLEIVRFGTTKSANKAVADGKIDGNIVQTEPYLQSYLEGYRYNNLISLGKVYVRPIGIYSKKYENLASVPNDATVVLLESNIEDDTILGRELLLLQKAELLSLKNNPNTHTLSTFDVIHDDRKVLFKNALTETDLIDSFINNKADLFILDQSSASKIDNSNKYLLFSEDVTSAYPRILR